MGWFFDNIVTIVVVAVFALRIYRFFKKFQKNREPVIQKPDLADDDDYDDENHVPNFFGRSFEDDEIEKVPEKPLPILPVTPINSAPASPPIPPVQRSLADIKPVNKVNREAAAYSSEVDAGMVKQAKKTGQCNKLNAIAKLPVLKQAVIMSEILGPPKGMG